MRVTIYARFSSDLQDARSIIDQVALAKEYAQRHGWKVVAQFSDAAISGDSLHNRSGLLDMLMAAKERRFDAVLTESLDRLSRDLEDIAGMYKRLAFWGVKIITLADGEVGKLHVGLKGLIANLYLEDLAQKTRRGQIGRVRAGRIPGGRCYGYDIVIDGDERGRRAINFAEAAVVKRIFAEYVAGASPISIATRLNRERVPAPRSGQWNASTLNGSRKRANGILSNSLYAGRITYNRQRFIKDPTTGKRQARPNPGSEWLTAEVPELTIVDSDTWETAQARRAINEAERPERRRRPKHLLSGLVECGACSGSMIVVRDDRLGCSARINKGTCNNRRTIRLREIEERVLKALQAHLLAPDAVALAVETYRAERQRLAREYARDRSWLDRQLCEVKRKIARIIEMVEAGANPNEMAPRLNDLSIQKQELKARLSHARSAKIVELHPQAADRYRQKVADIHAALTKGDQAANEAVTLVRELIDRIVVHPSAPGSRMRIELTGNIAGLMREPSANRGRDNGGCGGTQPPLFGFQRDRLEFGRDRPLAARTGQGFESSPVRQ
jgi:DNA invertase Pin-like site-specific DNA recombinase